LFLLESFVYFFDVVAISSISLGVQSRDTGVFDPRGEVCFSLSVVDGAECGKYFFVPFSFAKDVDGWDVFILFDGIAYIFPFLLVKLDVEEFAVDASCFSWFQF